MNVRLTINRYGAVCLNAASVFFGDIDTALDPRKPEKPVMSAAAVDGLLGQVCADFGVSFRVYATAAGVRLIELRRGDWNPRSPDTRELLRALHCDKAYIALTGRQNCFRARLTPKPWRAPVPVISSMSEAESYAAAGSYRVAHFLGHAGEIPSTIPAEVEEVVELHDRLCRVDLLGRELT